ncbi:MAG: endolytic transglycosylase MltG [Desulfuromonadales bacterium]|nr:endolytic transglycosylase MltG [Desulfuromonadales bacterium]
MLNAPRRAEAAKPKRRRVLVWLVLVAGVTLLITGAFGLRQWFFQHWPVTPPGIQRVKIAPGSALPQIALQLEQAGVVGDAQRFARLVRWREAAQKIKAGEYAFSKAATPGEVLDRLVAGDVIKVRITIPEGFALREIAARVAAAGIGTAEQFLRLASDPVRIRNFGIPATTLEGYLFPETYVVTTTTAQEEVIRAMVAQLNKQLTPELLAAAKARGLDRHALVTLASIVQKEAGNEEEMPLIAAAFHNRLRKGMRLQADPTVIYGVVDFDGNLTRRHLTTPTPYNTYTRAGLPPGPIASPGLAALRAAAFPAQSQALYFVARGDGRHEFNVTLEAHNRAVRRFQLGGR